MNELINSGRAATIIESNQKVYIEFFAENGFSFNCKDINPVLHAYKTNAMESFKALLLRLNAEIGVTSHPTLRSDNNYQG